jgi:hypothetical protein
MAEQEVAVLSPQKRRADNITVDKSIKKTKMTDITQEVNPKQASDSYEEENINGNSEEDEYSFGEEEDGVSDDCEEDEPSRSLRQEENDGSRSINAEEKEEEEEGYAGSSEDESSGSDGETRGVRFAEGSNAFRAAFSRIMKKKSRGRCLGYPTYSRKVTTKRKT